MPNDFDDIIKKIAGVTLPEASAVRQMKEAFEAQNIWKQASAANLMSELDRQRLASHHFANIDQSTLLSAKLAAEQFLRDDYNTKALFGQAHHDWLTNSAATEALRSQASATAAALNSAIMGPLADLRSIGALDITTAGSVARYSELLNVYEAQFKVPTAADLASLAGINSASALYAKYEKDVAAFTKSLDAPFLRIDEARASLAAFTELQSISRAVASTHPFDDFIIKGLRDDFGDWRNISAIPESISDVALRTTFYTERGYRTDLTDFPAEAFDAGLSYGDDESPETSLENLFGPPIELAEGVEVSAFMRTNEVQGWLTRFEIRIREFIDEVMTKEYGADWPRLKLQPEIYKDWLEKSAKAAAAGKPDKPLILFADFTHYELIVCNRGNWKHFSNEFGVKDALNVRESFQRLLLPRIEAYHGRLLTLDDYLFVYAELKRLGRALKRKN